jgi:hypothetical protein
MDGASGSHSFWGGALRDLLAGLARFRSPEFEALLTGFIGDPLVDFTNFFKMMAIAVPIILCALTPITIADPPEDHSA